MQPYVNLALTEDDVKFLLGALDRAQFQGLATARAMAILAEKLVLSLKSVPPETDDDEIRREGISSNGDGHR